MGNRELIEYSLNEEFKYRHLLNLGKESFGIEIEMEYINYNQAERLIRNRVDNSWSIKDDISLNLGMEIASPVLQDQKEVWKLLLKLSKTLQCLNPTFDRASFQVNLDNHLFLEQLIMFLKFFSIYEDVIYRFSRGTDSDLRQTIYEYALSIKSVLKSMELDNRSNEDIKSKFQNRKKFSVSLKSDAIKEVELSTMPIKIIEFRTPNGTINPLLWQNYINTFYHILKYVGGNSFDIDRIEYKWLHTSPENEMEDYVKMNIEKAIAFANLIFEEDIDKIYFLKQYIGDDYSKVKV